MPKLPSGLVYKAIHGLVDRKHWLEGEYDDEPDFLEWVDSDTGYLCTIIRVPHSGSLCGYVDIPPGHPWHGQFYDSIECGVHGGLTYSNPRNTFWRVGFDCAHAFDYSPAMDALWHPEGKLAETVPDHERMSVDFKYGWMREDSTYRTLEYVIEQVEGVCRQAFDTSPSLEFQTAEPCDDDDIRRRFEARKLLAQSRDEVPGQDDREPSEAPAEGDPAV